MKNSNIYPDKFVSNKNQSGQINSLDSDPKHLDPESSDLTTITIIADYTDRLDLVLSDSNKDKLSHILRTQGSRTPESRTRFKKLIKDGFVKVNSNIVKKPRFKVNPGDEITYIDFSYKPEFNIKPQNIKLDIIYEDQNVIVINKKQGQVVHPGAGNLDKTILNGIIFKLRFDQSRLNQSRLGNIGSNLSNRPGVVHRLDKDTTGVMLFAKDEKTLNFLVDQFKKREVEKTYLVLASGFVKSSVKGSIYIDKSNFTVKGFIKRSNSDRRKFIFSDTGSNESVSESSKSIGKESITNFKILRYIESKATGSKRSGSNGSRSNSVSDRFTLLEAYPKTGRTHQIRVALSSIGHPVVGDKVYSIKSYRNSFNLNNYKNKKQQGPTNRGSRNQDSKLNNMYLHSLSLKLKIPSTEDGSGVVRTFIADVPSFWSKTIGFNPIRSRPARVSRHAV